VVDVTATEASGELVMCAWPSRAQTARAARAYRRHYLAGHLRPFLAGTSALMRYIVSPMTGIRADVTVSKLRKPP
jgi:hypothetical protein